MTVPRLKQQIPLYSVAVQHPKAEGYNLNVNDLWFRTVASREVPIQIGTRDSLAQRTDDSASIYNNVLDIGYAWGRTDLSGGEGLDWSPRQLAIEQDEAAFDELRYWDSDSINTTRPSRGEKYSLHLSNTVQGWGITSTNPIDMATSDNYIFVADGDTVKWFSSWSTTIPTASDVVLAATNIVAIAASPSDTCMAVLANGDVWAMRAYPNQVVFSKVYDSTVVTNDDAKGVWYASGRFFIATSDGVDGGGLRSLEFDGTDYDPPVNVDTCEGEFVSVVESGPAIVAACTDGTVRTYTPDTGTAGLPLLPRSRSTMPKGEQPILLGSNSGILLILTASESAVGNRQNLRIYQAEVLDARFDYVVGQRQLKREWYAATHPATSTRNIASSRDEMFWFINEDVGGTLRESLWRYDVVTGGLSRVRSEAGVDYQSIVIFDSIIGAIDTVGDAFFVQSTNYEGFGWMIFPNITFGLNTDISWLAITMEAQNLILSGGTVELWVSTDPDAISDYEDVSWQLVHRITAISPEESVVQLGGLESRTIALQLRMYATATTYTPTVSRIAIRGIPSQRDVLMVVPINTSDYVSVPGRMPTHVPNLGSAIHATVMDLVGKSVDVTMLDPPVEFRGILNNISEPTIYQAPRGSVMTYVMAEFRGELVTSPNTGVLEPQNDGFAVAAAGMATAGVDQNAT